MGNTHIIYTSCRRTRMIQPYVFKTTGGIYYIRLPQAYSPHTHNIYIYIYTMFKGCLRTLSDEPANSQGTNDLK